MKRNEPETDGLDPDANRPERSEPASSRAPGDRTPGAEADRPPDEPSGLIGVDVPPLPPPSREEVEGLRRECEELRDQLLRKRAEFENYRKRVERDRQQATQEATAELLRSLVSTLDNLERALRAVGDEEALRQGVELIHRNLQQLLEGQGLAAFDPLGEKFDPQRHQAIAHEPAPGFADGTVVEVLQKGYFFKERLLRPALVKVAKGTADEAHDEPEAIH